MFYWLEAPKQLFYCADDAEGILMQLLHEQWVTGPLVSRSEFARAGMRVLTQLWESQGPSSHVQRLHAHLDATILEEVPTLPHLLSGMLDCTCFCCSAHSCSAFARPH